MREPVFAYAAVIFAAVLRMVPFFAVALHRRRWIRNWLVAFPYLSLLAVGLAANALNMDVRIFSDGITVESFASAIAILVTWFAIPIGVAAYLDRRWQQTASRN